MNNITELSEKNKEVLQKIIDDIKREYPTCIYDFSNTPKTKDSIIKMYQDYLDDLVKNYPDQCRQFMREKGNYGNYFAMSVKFGEDDEHIISSKLPDEYCVPNVISVDITSPPTGETDHPTATDTCHKIVYYKEVYEDDKKQDI